MIPQSSDTQYTQWMNINFLGLATVLYVPFMHFSRLVPLISIKSQIASLLLKRKKTFSKTVDKMGILWVEANFFYSISEILWLFDKYGYSFQKFTIFKPYWTVNWLEKPQKICPVPWKQWNQKSLFDLHHGIYMTKKRQVWSITG